jgi:dsRNA-specific ribonuclease
MGDEEWKKRLNDSGYKNWLKVSLALIESKEALHDFTEKVILDVHKDIKTTAGSGTCTATPSCNTNKGKEPTCPSCAKWVTEIRKYRSDGQLQWKNTDPKMWRTVPWEIAKCFMNAQGGKATAAANTGPAKTDLSGMLNVLVNCKEFRRNYLKDKKLPEHVRTVRNHLMHCATMSFSDAEMQGMVDKVIALLEDDKELKHLKVSKDKVKLIKSLRDSEFELKPKDEEVCIETVLESHALAADSGEEIDESMMSKLSKLIKGNKELERKFNKIDEKFANMKQEYNAEISRVDIDLGELKGRIEFLEKKLASGQSFPSSNPTSSVLGHEIKSFYKNALQSCAQKKKLDIPKYNTNETKEKMFVSIVLFDGKEFKSKPKPSKKDAEQDAAEEALKFLGNEDSEVSNEKNESPSAELQVMDSTLSTQQKGKNYKNLLQEKAQKQKIPYPIYFNKKTDTGFLSEVMYDGGTYSPVMDPQNRKVDAEQKAAQFVLTYLDRYVI